MAGFVGDAGADGARKIKGGRWTVFRFFLVSVAFTSAWLAVSSQLGYYRTLHGPAVLLQLNIAYYLPSIPLLVVSALLDKPLEARLGVARTILVRLLLGLLGYGAVCAWFPLMPDRIWFLLGAVVALGLFSGIAFSASYQLVARFANKNVIALGLGCSASGPLVLVLQLALGMGPEPTRQQQILLYEFIALIIVAGLWATVSLLVRHWKSIEAHASKHQDLTEPLLQQQSPRNGSAVTPLALRAAAAADEGRGSPLHLPHSPLLPAHEPHSPTTPQQLLALTATVWKQRSLPPLVTYNSLEPFQTFLSTDQEVVDSLSGSWEEGGLLAGSPAAGSAGLGAASSGLERQLSAPPAILEPVPESPTREQAAVAEEGAGASRAPPALQLHIPAYQQVDSGTGTAAEAAAGAPEGTAGGGSGGGASWQALRLIWAPLGALSLSSCIALTLFPLFTYVPTSGLLGEALPKVLFFVRIFSDVLGRFLPRLSLLAAKSPLTPLVAAGAKLAGVPIMLLYLKSPDRFHSDVAAVIFIALLWLLGGYINTMSNMLAPKLVPPQLKGTAAGMMAIAYQVAHFLGLALATLTVYLLYGHIGVEV